MARRKGSCLWRGVLALGAALLLSTPAMADGKLPNPVVMVIDVQAAMQQSAAGKDIMAKRDQYLQSFQSDVEKNRKALKVAEDELVKQKTSLPQDVWQQKAREFEQKVFDFNQHFQKTNVAVEKSFRAAMAELSHSLAIVTEEVAAESGANLVLPKSQIFLHDPAMEMTDTVIERLNRKYPTVTFPVPAVDGEASAATPAKTTNKKK